MGVTRHESGRRMRPNARGGPIPPMQQEESPMDSMPQDRPGDSRAPAAQAYLTEVSQRPVDRLRPRQRYGIEVGHHRGTAWFTQAEMRKGPVLSLGSVG